MSGDAILPQCRGCGTRDGQMRHNNLIGGWYCERCDKMITAADPKLEARYTKANCLAQTQRGDQMSNYLQDPERARAYAHLIEHPFGSLRTWATALSWTTGKVQRFIATLRREHLGEILATKHGTSFTPSDPNVHRLASMCIDVHRCASAPYLGTGSGLTGSRYGEAPEANGNGATAPPGHDSGAELLITALNEVMRHRFDENFAPIRSDHRGSIKAAERIIGAGVPLEDAIVIVRQRAMAFTPDRTGGGLPHSLGHPFLAKGTIDEWRRRERDREQLTLLPKLEMEVERTPPPPAGSSPLPPEPDRPPATTEQLAAFRAEFDRAANDPNPRRLRG
jgi:hypothetical protein